MPVRKNENLVKLGMAGASYLMVKESEDALATQKTNTKKEIERLLEDPTIPVVLNGKHKEITVELEDGQTKIFIQKQFRDGTVKPIDNIIDAVRSKLGEEADKFIILVPVLQSNALEQMLSEGLITLEDLKDWTVKGKPTVALIVKEVSNDSNADKG